MNPDWPAALSSEEKLRFFIQQMLQHLLDDQRPAWHAQLMMREMAEPTAACVKLVEAYIRPLTETLRSIIRDLLPDSASDVELWMIGASIFGQCLFYKVHRPVIQLLMGPEQFSGLTVEQLAEPYLAVQPGGDRGAALRLSRWFPRGDPGMNWIAWKMLTGDRAKYFGIVFGVAFGSLLISHQTSIFRQRPAAHGQPDHRRRRRRHLGHERPDTEHR